MSSSRRMRRRPRPTGVLAAPMIPGINDAELERILADLDQCE